MGLNVTHGCFANGSSTIPPGGGHLSGSLQKRVLKFAVGCERAANAGETVVFC